MSMATSKRALVVGGTSGIGTGIALALAKRNYDVIIAGRSEERGKEIIESMQQGRGSTNINNHKFIPIDAFDLNSVKSVTEKVGPIEDIDLLVMTQGMATIQGYTPTVNNIDQKLQLHYFSRIYLAKLMAPKMKSGSRIFTVLSAGVHSKYHHAADDFELKNNYSIKNAADAAGYYTDAGFEKLSNLYPEVTVCHAAPGFVNTSWGSEMPNVLKYAIIRPMQKLFGTSLEKCGETLTSGLLDNIPNNGGYHLLDQKGQLITSPKAIKHTPEERDIIWEKTLQLLPDLQ